MTDNHNEEVYCAEGGWPAEMVDNTPIPVIADKPPHYSLGEREVIDVIRDAGWLDHYLKANILKYILRCEHKDNETLDIQKAVKCASMWLEEYGG